MASGPAKPRREEGWSSTTARSHRKGNSGVASQPLAEEQIMTGMLPRTKTICCHGNSVAKYSDTEIPWTISVTAVSVRVACERQQASSARCAYPAATRVAPAG